MKKLLSILAIGVLSVIMLLAGCSSDFVLTEKTFFAVITNVQYYPKKYINKYIEFDCFTYELVDSDGDSYMLGVRKCSAEYGCACGNDTVIGFILEYDGEIPAPINQSSNDNDKMWIHIRGMIKSTETETLSIFAYDSDGNITDNTEPVEFLTFAVETLSIVEDYSNLNYYVTK